MTIKQEIQTINAQTKAMQEFLQFLKRGTEMKIKITVTTDELAKRAREVMDRAAMDDCDIANAQVVIERGEFDSICGIDDQYVGARLYARIFSREEEE